MYIIVSVGLYKREKNGRHAHLKLQLQLLVYDWLIDFELHFQPLFPFNAHSSLGP